MKIDKSELLRYLGYRGQEYGERLDEDIDKAIELCLRLVTPRSVIKKFALEKNPLRLVGADMALMGADILNHLQGCDEVYIMGATIGFDVEKKVSELMKTNPLQGVLLDSASICAIESYCDDLCEQLQSQNERALTARFSCGYGDFPLSQQKDFIRILELQKRIGVFIHDDSCMLSPQKSVTAVVGINTQGGTQRPKCQSKCLTCTNKKCIYRK